MTTRVPNRLRSLFAMFCLVAVVFLYAPLGGAAWSLYSMACCTSSQCPIKGHHAQHIPATPQHEMDCGHDMAAMGTCSMSCCHNPDRPALTPVIFVLPTPLAVSVSKTSAAFVPFLAMQNSLRSIEPLSPPPRSSSLRA